MCIENKGMHEKPHRGPVARRQAAWLILKEMGYLLETANVDIQCTLCMCAFNKS